MRPRASHGLPEVFRTPFVDHTGKSNVRENRQTSARLISVQLFSLSASLFVKSRFALLMLGRFTRARAKRPRRRSALWNRFLPLASPVSRFSWGTIAPPLAAAPGRIAVRRLVYEHGSGAAR